MWQHTGDNLQRLMAERGLSTREVARHTGIDERTLRALSRGQRRPRPLTVHRLAEGLGIPVEELLVDPASTLRRRFDRVTNPAVEELVRTRAELFHDWTSADFDELYSRVGTGGELTTDGAEQVVERMNHRRRLHGKLDLLLESTHGELVGQMIELMYRQVAIDVDEADTMDGPT